MDRSQLLIFDDVALIFDDVAPPPHRKLYVFDNSQLEILLQFIAIIVDNKLSMANQGFPMDKIRPIH